MSDQRPPPLLPPHPASLDDETLLARCARRTGRASGPGGQHRNKVETAVVLTDKPTDLSAQASERRSQAENQHVALKRLRLKLAIEYRTARDHLAVPSPGFAARCKDGKIAVNPKHADYPALLAEALDVLFALKLDAPKAASLLNLSTSQLIKLIAKSPAALQHVNQARKDRHQPTFKA